MAGEWETVRFGDLADSVSETHRLGKDRLVFLNTSDILFGRFLHGTYTPVKDWPGQAKKSIRKDDILFSEIRPANGRWAYVDIDADDYVVSTKLMVIRASAHRVAPRFIYHFLTSAGITGWLQHLAESRSGTFPQITFDQVAELELYLPPLADQNRIVGFLDAIAAKIELNRRMNETLEAMARALFQSWFVDFDPVKMKCKGRRAKGERRPSDASLRPLPFDLSPSLLDLFPDSFEDSELGAIPRGWRVGLIGDLAEVVGGSTPSTKVAAFWEDGEHIWATPKDLSALSTPVLLETGRKISSAGLSQIGSGLLPPGTVLLSSRAPIGYLAIAEVPVAINQGFIAMRPKKGVSNLFLLYWAAQAQEQIVSRANGSTFLEISKANFRPIPVVTPPSTIISAFDKQVRPLYGRVVSNERESRTLAALRDALLPRLLSGEVRVGTTKQCVGGVGQ